MSHPAEVQKWDPPEISDSTTLAMPGDIARATMDVQRSPGPKSPGELIEYAIANKLPAAELKEMVELHERMEDRNAARAFNQALAAFQRECPPIKKNKSKSFTTSTGGTLSWTYAEMDEIEAHIRPYLEKYELAVSFDQQLEDKGAQSTAICTVAHVLGHSRTSRFTVPTTSNSAASPQQKVGAADSYAKRRALGSALGLNITDKQVPDAEVDPTPISDDQAIELNDLLSESGASKARFFAFMEVDAIGKIRAADYEKAKNALRERKKTNERKQERAQ